MEEKSLALVLWQIFSSSQGVGPLILMYHSYIHILFTYTFIIHIYLFIYTYIIHIYIYSEA